MCVNFVFIDEYFSLLLHKHRISNVDTTSPDSLSVNIISDVFVTRRGSTVISTANIQITANSIADVRLRVIQGRNNEHLSI